MAGGPAGAAGGVDARPGRLRWGGRWRGRQRGHQRRDWRQRAAGPGRSGRRCEPIRWDYFIFVGNTHPIGQYALEFAEAVRERTGGRLEITVRPAGELPYKATEAVRITSDGSVQMADGYVGFVAGDSKVAALPGLPFLIRNFDEFKTAYPALEPHLLADLERQGVVLLYTYTWPPQNVWGREQPIRTLADFAGRKIRTTSPEQAALIEKLKAEPVTFTTAEVPAAMQRGVMDAVLTAGFNALGSQWQEFLDWGYLPDIHIGPSYILVNREAYAALPSEVREQLDAVAAEFEQRQSEEIIAREADDRRTLAAQHGLELIEARAEDVEAATELMKPYWEEWAAQAGAAAQAALADVRQALAK